MSLVRRSSGGAVASVSNSDGTLTISPTTGAIVVSINLAHANTWTAVQTFSATNIATDTTTGMKIGTSTSQKIAFFNSTPIVKPSGDVATALSNLGLVSSPTISGTISGLTTTYIPKASSATALADSQMYDDGTYVYISKSASASMISGGTGSLIGDMTDNGGLAAAFNGTTSQAYGSSALSTSHDGGPHYTGKNWGGGNSYIITKYIVYGTLVQGFDSSGSAGTITMSLYGSNSAPANPTNGTQLHTTSFTDTKDATPHTITAGITVTTAYQYHWVTISSTKTGDFIAVGQIQFFVTAGSPALVLQNNGATEWYLSSNGTSGNNFNLNNSVGTTMIAVNQSGAVGISVSSPTAMLHLPAGTATASTSPLKFTSGTNLTTAESGAMEYNGTNLFFTRTGTTRENVLVAVDNVSAPSTSVGVGIVNYYGSAATNFLGQPNRWISVNVLGSVYKIPLYT